MEGNIHIGTVPTGKCAATWRGMSATGYGVFLLSGEWDLVLMQRYVDCMSTGKFNVVGRIG